MITVCAHNQMEGSMQNQHSMVLFVSGLLFLNHTVKAMELDRANRIEEYTMMYRVLSEGELRNELTNLELQLAEFTGNDFAFYTQQPDKLNFLQHEFVAAGNTMPTDMLYCVQKIIAVLSTLQTRKQQAKTFWGESE
jgi:hypothetical protein